MSPTRLRVRVRGVVQGVGFRPFVHGLATRLGLDGFVRNDGDAVTIEIQGDRARAFVDELRRAPPARSRVDDLALEELPARASDRGFAIVESALGSRVAAGIGPDTSACDACVAELFDPSSRRYLYPFTHCATCGPRYTITRALPYDRPRTSMADFAMCARCAAEHADPADRRFHAEVIACPACGPRMSSAPSEIVKNIADEGVVAIQGVGGFHLACDARSERAASRLREAKARDAKPFALMVPNLASARAIANLDADEEAELVSAARPIVIAHRRASARVAEAIAPGLPWLGIMLPYAPIHFLVFHEASGRPDGLAWLDEPCPLVLVMTSGNLGGEPVIADPREARARLGPIADLVVTHDRAIVARCDDSVVRVAGGATTLVRRARGFAPVSIRLPRAVPEALGLGAHEKTTIAMTRGDRAWVSPYVGDLDDPETIEAHRDALAHLRRVLAIEPRVVGHDLHPDFRTTRMATGLGVPAIAVQHHHAHVAAVLAEHGHDGPALGIALDGFGYGPGGALWGGELLFVDGPRFERVGHLAELRQPGGDAAAREPWRMAAAALHRMERDDEIIRRFSEMRGMSLIVEMLRRGVRAPLTSSCGRWFDAAAALSGIGLVARYESEAPMLFEGLVRAPRVLEGAWSIDRGVLDPLPLLEATMDMDPADAADAFHGTFAAAVAAWAIEASEARGLSTIALSGGCMLNGALVASLVPRLQAAGVTVLRPRALPPGDGAISLGQAWVAALSVA
jgi:hydrogenase maturation protein HypF